MPTPCRLTIWIGAEPPLVVDSGRDGDFVVREAAGDYNFAGTTAGQGFQVTRGSRKHYVYTITARDSEEKRAILHRIKNRQHANGPPISLRDETQRLDVTEIDGIGSRQRLDTATFPDAERSHAGGAIIVSHFESIGILEVADRFESLVGPANNTNYSDLVFRIIEVV